MTTANTSATSLNLAGVFVLLHCQSGDSIKLMPSPSKYFRKSRRGSIRPCRQQAGLHACPNLRWRRIWLRGMYATYSVINSRKPLTMGDSYKKEQHEKAYGEGVREARESDALSQMAHNVNPFEPSTTTEKSREAGWRDYFERKTNSRDSHRENKERKSSKKSHRTYSSTRDYYSTSSSTEGARTGGSLNSSHRSIRMPQARASSAEPSYRGDLGGVVFVTLAVLLVGGIIVFFIKLNLEIPERERVMFQSSGSVPGRRVNANDLNLRSGPGLNYSLVRTFHRGDVVVDPRDRRVRQRGRPRGHHRGRGRRVDQRHRLQAR